MNRGKILIVEDELLVAENIKDILSRTGKYNIEVTSDGNEAIKVSEDYKPNLVMLDIKLKSKPDGIETGKIINNICNPGFVVVTAYADKKTIDRTLTLNPYGYVVKPFTDRELSAAVEVAYTRYNIEKDYLQQKRWTEKIVENLPYAVLFKDRSFIYHPLNRTFYRMFRGYEKKIINKTDFDFFPLKLASKIRREDKKLKNGEIRKVKKEIFAKPLKKWLLVEKVPIFEDNGEFSGIVISLQDITDEKKKNGFIELLKNEVNKMEKLVTGKEKRLKKEVYRRSLTKDIIHKLYQKQKFILESIPDGMIYHNKLYRIEWANKAAYNNIFHSNYEIYGKRCIELMPCGLNDVRTCPVYQTLQEGKEKEVEITFQNKIWLIRTFLLKNEDSLIEGVLEIITDITEKKKYENNILRNQKMRVIGKLTSGIAHDFNNILTVIKGYSELIRMDINPEDPIYSDINEIYQASRKAEILIKSLLTFTKRNITKKETISLNSIVTSMKNMLDRLLEDDIILEMKLNTSIPEIYIDKSHIEQIIMNLIVNARDAMPDGGKVIIRTDVIGGSELKKLKKINKVTNKIITDKKYVLLSIEDTGYGMDKNTIDRIFEPFFSLKENGTGIGLSTVKDIVESSNGFITVESIPQKGSKFKIYFEAIN